MKKLHSLFSLFVAVSMVLSAFLSVSVQPVQARIPIEEKPASAPNAPQADASLVDDFESGMPATWFTYGDWGGGSAVANTLVTTSTLPGGGATNTVLSH